MNKYFIILIVLAVIFGGGITYRVFFAAERAAVTGEVREFTVTAQKNKWNWSPETFNVNQGDLIKITVVNEDDYDHGFAIDQFGVSQRLPARGTIKVEFIANTPGEWPYYCSVACGDGMVDGKSRGHFDQIGKVGVMKVNAVPQP
jgi:heme/copper-type cytochrome/quinol oxidase subunit 2